MASFISRGGCWEIIIIGPFVGPSSRREEIRRDRIYRLKFLLSINLISLNRRIGGLIGRGKIFCENVNVDGG